MLPGRGKIHLIILGLITAIGHSTYAQTPVIYSVDRQHGPQAEVVRLMGADFGTNPSDVVVFFGGTRADVSYLSDRLIEVFTPAGTTFEPIRVTRLASGRSAIAPGQFFLNYRGEAGISAAKFSAQSDFQAESGLYDLCLCDFNGDRRVDVATASNTANLATVFQNNSVPGTVSLTGQSLATGARTLHVRCGDLNGDGRPDIVLSEGADGSRVFVATNNGGFNFSIQAITLTGMKVKQVAIADLDLDGRPDIVVTNTGGNVMSILPNTSTTAISFGTPVSLAIPQASSTDALAIGDLDGDRYPEIVTSQYQADNENKLFIAKNQGSFTFGGINVLTVNKAVSSIRLADLDADSKLDIAIARLTGSDISVYLNSSSGTISFRNPQFFITEMLPVGMDFGDFDGDGKLDVAVGSIAKAVSVLNNITAAPGTANFSPAVKLPATFINRNLRSADMDGDGRPDIIFTSVDDFSGAPTPASKISVLRNLSCMIPEVTPGGPLTYCAGSSVRLQATPGGGVTYQWFLDGNASPVKSGTDAYLDVTSSGEYRVVAVSTSPACSKESNRVTVSFTAPTATLNAADPEARSNSPVCSDNKLILQVNDVGATEYRWTGPNGFSQNVTTTTVERTGFNLQSAGRYYVDIMAGSCVARTESTLVESVTVPDFVISYSGSENFCAGGSKDLSVSPSLSAGFTYQWYEQTQGLIPEATFRNYSADASGVFYAVVTPANAGCVPKETAPVTVVEYSLPTAGFLAPESGCSGEEIFFTQQSSGHPGASLTYLWTFGDGKTSGEASPGNTYAAANTFEVTLKVAYAGADACAATASKFIQVFAVTRPRIISSAEAICEGDEAVLSVANGFAEVTWNTNETETEISVTQPGDYSVTTLDLHGCEAHDEFTVGQKPLPALTVSAERTVIAAGQNTGLQATGADEYSWSPGKTLNDSTVAAPIASPSATTTYVVTGSLVDGCQATATITLQVSGEIVNITVPALFSPNGDPMNETLIIQGVENYPDCSFNVFDKRGARVFGTTGYQNNWNGTINGSPVPEGVYYFVFGCPNSKSVTGTVAVVR